MKLKKAIEILEIDAQQSDYTDCPDFLASIRLSIEALKFTQAVRGTILSYATLPLPGETPPDEPNELSDLIRAQFGEKGGKQ